MDQITNEQALEVIKEMIERTKRKQNYAGFYHLLWGVLISLAIVAMYILIKFEMYDLIGFSWAFFGIGGAIVSVIYSKRTYEKQGSIQYPDLGINSIWMGLMIAMFLVAFVFPILKAYEWYIVYVMVSLLLGAANFSTGILLKQKMPIINGILWWIGSIFLLILENQVAFMGVFVLLLIVNNVIPGIYLYSLARKQNGK
ncbi:MAG: hypothetical protein KAS53_11070 [Candidatus Cloacimonetes bacterium]|nr:hypothetical protein [Candidatus Cloacimonadota bacterium]